MKPLAGFSDHFGAPLRRRRYLARVFAAVCDSFGFDPLEVSIIEHARAYDETIVGESPWPEWNPAGVFSLELPHYDKDYVTPTRSDAAVLIPEGTLSVTRWLGNILSTYAAPQESPLLPLKVYYDIACYRNELAATLSSTKGRQFTQFGVEILGSSTIAGDLEVMCIAAEALSRLGVNDAAIAFRISSNALYTDLANRSGLSHTQSIQLKELLDTMGECKVGKGAHRLTGTRDKALALIAESQANSYGLADTWQYVIDRAPGPITETDYAMLGDYTDELSYMICVAESLAQLGPRVDIDFCVVRSHEYYTGLTFEIDLIDPDGTRAVEVGGGGRYDRLLGNFVEGHPGIVIPSMGYAFGLERLLSALEQRGYLQTLAEDPGLVWDLTGDPTDHYHLEPADADMTSCAAAYVNTLPALREARLTKRVSVRLTP